MSRYSYLFVLVAAAGCAEDPSVAGARIHITESERELSIVQVDSTGAAVGRVSLRVGEFFMEEYGRTVNGRQLEVVAGGLDSRHESEGFARLLLPVISGPGNSPLNELLQEPRVRDALDRWQVGLEQPVEPGLDALFAQPVEAARSACTYATCNLSGQSTASCAERYYWYKYMTLCNVVAEQLVCCTGSTPTLKRASQRRCGYTDAGCSSCNPCGAEGANGCKLCWSNAWTSSCTASSGSATTPTCSDHTGDYEVDTTTISITYN